MKRSFTHMGEELGNHTHKEVRIVVVNNMCRFTPLEISTSKYLTVLYSYNP